MTSRWSVGRELPKIEFSQKELKQYSLRRAMLAAVDPTMLCLEREVSDTLKKSDSKLVAENHGIFIPTNMGIKATLNVTTATDGKETVDTELQPLIEILRNRLVLKRAGAQVLTGLRGNLLFPRQTASTEVNWKAESDAAEASDAQFDSVAMSPKRLTAKTSFTVELLSQSSLEMESFVRNDIAFKLAEGIDYAGFNGSGVAPVPKGILQQTGINSVTWDATKKFERLVDMESEISIDNADVDSMAYVTTPEVRGMLKKTPQLANAINLPVWTGGRMDGEVNGYRAFATNNLPKTLSGGAQHAVLFGDFSQCIIGEWGVLELIVDPYTRADEGEYVVNARLLADIAVRHPEAFCLMTVAIS